MARFNDFDRLQAIAPNFKQRLSGVTSTIVQLVPEQQRQGLVIATLGPGLPAHFPQMRFRDLWRLWKRPVSGNARIWHARRNVEMIAGIALRSVLRMPLKLVFTSAAQRDHKPLTKWLIRRMDGVIATSTKSGSFLHVPHTVIMHGIDTERFVPPADKAAAKRAVGLDPERRVIGCTGRIRHSKGTDLFVDAMIKLLPDHPEWEAIITGRATSENEAFKRKLEQRIADAALSDRIRFVGEVDDIVPWYQGFDLFVAPSRQEGFGLTPLEAMACGVPCVTSDAGSYSDMIDDGVNGFCIPADDGSGLTIAIGQGVEITANNGFEHDAIRKHVLSKFTLKNEASAVNRVYREILGRRAA
ncbi:MAG: glycosyltransferase family 4 protein [Pseudomonadota bacterium]